MQPHKRSEFMLKFNTTIFLSICFSIFTPLYGQTYNDTSKLIDPELAKQDFKVFRDSLFQMHPCIDRYNDKQKLNHLFDSCYSTLTDKVSEISLYGKFKFLLSSIEDGHLSINPTPELRNYMNTTALVFPVSIYFTSNKAFVICDNANQIQSGSELLSINDNSINEIKKTLFHYIVSDGSINTKKRWILNNYFWFYYYLVYGESVSFTVRYKQKNKTETTTISSCSFKNSFCLQKDNPSNKNLFLSFQSNDIAVLTIKSFNQQDFDDSKENYKDFLKNAFLEIRKKNVQSLIIDIRQNGGGRDVYGSLLYSYLTNKPFHYYKSLETKTRQLTQQDHPNLAVQFPVDNNFSGRIIFIIDGQTFSTAAEFCSIAKSNDRGLFIGEETGGGYYGNNSGNSVEIILPNTKFTISVPTTKYTMDVKSSIYPDRGIKPDIEVLPVIDDIINKRDMQLNYALKLASRK